MSTWISENAVAHEQERAVRDVDPALQEPVEFGETHVMPWMLFNFLHDRLEPERAAGSTVAC